VLGLGTVWILDGLEVTIVGSIGSRLQDKDTLGLTASQIGIAGTFYIVGAAIGALGFGYLTDRLGRKKLFLVTLAVYLAATVATAFSWDAWSFWIFRMLTGLGIGGEYAAINSAIDELIPARVRGWVDLAINGSYWLGAAFGAALSVVVLDPSIFAANVGWRLTFGLGAVMGLAIMVVRRTVPESPRWLTIHGREEEGERLVSGIEDRVRRDSGLRELDEVGPDDELEIQQRQSTSFVELGRTLVAEYPKRAALGFVLMATQAFIYNAVVFTFTLIVTSQFKVSDSTAPVYLVPFALANFLGALLLGRLFDTVGRRIMIGSCYGVSAVGLFVVGLLLKNGTLGLSGYLVILCATFFVASAAASAGYLTVSEVFPLETRAMAIALFYAVATGIGGAVGPVLFGSLLGNGDPNGLFIGFAIGAGLMAIAAIVAFAWGVDAEQTSLEDVAEPLSAQEARAT
jgi:MFS family permease